VHRVLCPQEFLQPHPFKPPPACLLALTEGTERQRYWATLRLQPQSATSALEHRPQIQDRTPHIKHKPPLLPPLEVSPNRAPTRIQTLPPLHRSLSKTDAPPFSPPLTLVFVSGKIFLQSDSIKPKAQSEADDMPHAGTVPFPSSHRSIPAILFLLRRAVLLGRQVVCERDAAAVLTLQPSAHQPITTPLLHPFTTTTNSSLSFLYHRIAYSTHDQHTYAMIVPRPA